MLRIDIAGETLTYKNAPDLNDKVQSLLNEVKTKRAGVEAESKALRQRERMLERFLGGAKKVRLSEATQ